MSDHYEEYREKYNRVPPRKDMSMHEIALHFDIIDTTEKKETDNLPVNIIKRPVKTVIKRIYCKNCGSELISGGISLISSVPMKYRYHCNTCNTDYISAVKYPAICFEEKENDDT